MRVKTTPLQIVSLLFFPVAFYLLPLCIFAQTLAPGAPGKTAQWASAGKQGVGTSANLESKVWFTLQGGALTEVYYPDVTVANVHLLQFVVVNPKTKTVETELDDAVHKIEVVRPDSLTFKQINTAKSGAWKITKTYAVDPARDTILIGVSFESREPHDVYVYFDPSINNSALHDRAALENGALVAADADKAAALVSAADFTTASNGFFGTSDGLTELRQHQRFENYEKAADGNVVQFAPVPWQSGASSAVFESGKQAQVLGQSAGAIFALGFGKNSSEAIKTARASLDKGFYECLEEYETGWANYVKTLSKVEPKYQAQFNMAAMQLRAHEDKTARGANIASLSVPWGGGDNANENTVAGYHLIWSRDLYQVATAYMALGDKAAAVRALDFLFKVQQKPDGSFPQNSFLDGRPFWGSLQLDEVAFPLILAYQLGRDDKDTYQNHVKRAADFIVKTGPKTTQERWEEEAGFSPSTIAAEIAGLVCAAQIAKKNGDNTSADLYLKTADEWAGSVEKWTATKSGKYGDGNYYLRITQNARPDSGDKIELNNGAGFFDEREIVDAGFLELVRLGIKAPDDPVIGKSLKVIDQILSVQTPNGTGFYRYNHDGYGEMDDGRRWNFDGKYTGKGRLWALLSGERGQYELALSALAKEFPAKAQRREENTKEKGEDLSAAAKKRLDAMLAFANEGLMIPEQIWDKPETPANIDKQFVPELRFGEGTGSATPLAWSMAQFIRLAVNLQAGRNLDTPDVVYNRYVRDKKVSAKIINEKMLDLGQIFDCRQEFERMKMQSPEHSFLKQENGAWKVKQTPYQMIDKAIFFYQGGAQTVELVGDFSDWKPNKLLFQKIPNTSLQCFQVNFASSARVEYKIIADGVWQSDALNPNKVDNGVGSENSFFTMPAYKPTVWDKSEKVDLLPKFDEFQVNSKNFGVRTIKIYLPNEYKNHNETLPFPVMYLQDGTDYATRAKAAIQQENLVTAGKVKPFIIVLIDPKERMKEYWANDAFADFVATEVVPEVHKRFRTIKNRDSRALLGASLGGITSVNIAVKYPETFARVGGQSSSFWIDDERVIKELARLDARKTPFKFYFDSGTLEGAECNRRAVQILRERGFPVIYQETATGHNWTSWRDKLADAYTALWNN